MEESAKTHPKGTMGMKKNTQDTQASANRDEIKGWEGSVDFPMSEEKQAVSHKRREIQNPMLTFGMALCLVAAPIAGIAATNALTGGGLFNQRAEAATVELEVKGMEDDEEEEEEENVLSGVTPLQPEEVSEQDLDLFNIKRLGYEISEGGIIESAENIIVEPEGHTLRFIDSTKDGKITFKADDGYTLESALLEGEPVVIEGTLINIPAGARGTLRITFMVIVPPAEEPTNDNAIVDDRGNDSNDDNGGGNESHSDSNGGGQIYSIPEPQVNYEYEQSTDESQYQYQEPEGSYQESYEEPQGYYEEPQYESAPAATAGTAGMSGDELAMAQEIFDRYNDWRASQGLPRTQWDGTCCDMAMGSAQGCAARRKLVHRLGIPAECQTSYSDILQYASWRMSGDEAIQRWANSSGHAAQMRCPTAQNAACAVYQENGIYWFAIVYTFQGTNIG